MKFATAAPIHSSHVGHLRIKSVFVCQLVSKATVIDENIANVGVLNCHLKLYQSRCLKEIDLCSTLNSLKIVFIFIIIAGPTGFEPISTLLESIMLANYTKDPKIVMSRILELHPYPLVTKQVLC